MINAEAILGYAALPEKDALQMSPLQLAYVGDAVHDLLVRSALALGGARVHSMHRDAIQAVNAGAQARALERIEAGLTEVESGIVRRGRNAHAHHGVPKRADPRDYAMATGLEALLGFLYLTGQIDRLRALYAAMQGEA